MPIAYSYERVSTGLQAEKGRGLERQANAAEQWCAARGLELNETLRLSDAGRSAYKGDHLKGALGRFLELAQNDQLGEEPILLVEAIDRPSRLEAVDGLQDVLLALVRSGVSIVTLEDGAEYSRATLREDGSKLIILAVKAQAAWEYSRRLSKRVTAAWKQAEADLGKGVLPRAKFFCPPWAQLAEDGQITLIPEKVVIVERVFEYAMDDGDNAVSNRLNAEQIPTFSGKPKWTRTMVRRVLTDPRVWGAVRLCQMDRYSVQQREAMRDAGAEEKVFPDLLPLVIPKEQVDLVLARRTERSHPGSSTGRRTQTWNIASNVTRCSCGAAASLATTTSGSPRIVNGERLKLRYLRCAARCGAKGYRLDQLNGHILVRLAQGQLQQLLAGADSGKAKQIKQEEAAISRLQGQLAQAKQQQANASKLFKEALKQGTVDPLFKEAVEEARTEVESAEKALAGAQQRLAGIRHDVDSAEFDAAVADLFNAFTTGTDTPEQRQRINRMIQQAGLRVTLDRTERRIGMAIGDGPVDWQPFDPQAIEQALVARITSAQFRSLAFTEESVEALSALDPDMAEWFKSMVGVKQTAVASVNSKDLEAIQRFARDIQKNSPELAEAFRKMNQGSD